MAFDHQDLEPLVPGICFFHKSPVCFSSRQSTSYDRPGVDLKENKLGLTMENPQVPKKQGRVSVSERLAVERGCKTPKKSGLS